MDKDTRPRTEDAVRHLLAGVERINDITFESDENIRELIGKAIGLSESGYPSDGERKLMAAAIALHRGRGLDILDTLAGLDKHNRALVMGAIDIWNRATGG